MSILQRLAQAEFDKACILAARTIPIGDVVKLRILNGEIADLREELGGPPPWRSFKEMAEYLK